MLRSLVPEVYVTVIDLAVKPFPSAARLLRREPMFFFGPVVNSTLVVVA